MAVPRGWAPVSAVWFSGPRRAVSPPLTHSTTEASEGEGGRGQGPVLLPGSAAHPVPPLSLPLFPNPQYRHSRFLSGPLIFSFAFLDPSLSFLPFFLNTPFKQTKVVLFASLLDRIVTKADSPPIRNSRPLIPGFHPRSLLFKASTTDSTLFPPDSKSLDETDTSLPHRA